MNNLISSKGIFRLTGLELSYAVMEKNYSILSTVSCDRKIKMLVVTVGNTEILMS